MSESSLSKISVLLLIVGLAVGGGAGYVVSSNLMQSKVDEYEAEISDLTSEVSSLTSTISNLETEKSNFEKQLSDLENQVSSSETQISSLETQISNMEDQISALTDEISELEFQLSEEQSTVGDYESQIAYLESQVASMQRVLENYVPDTFTIGLTAFSMESLIKVQAVANITKEDINEYCHEKGIPFTFEFVVLNNYGEVNEAVENTILFKNMGINVVVGHETFRETSLSLQYANTHDMLLISPSATAQELAIPGDNLFRTCQSDLAHTVVMAESLDSWGIEAVVVIQRGDEWGDGVYEAFEDEFKTRGGVIHKRIRYDVDTTGFGGYLNQAEAAALNAVDEYGEDRVAIVLISRGEAVSIVGLTRGYGTLYNLYWFGSNNIAHNSKLFKNIPEDVDKLKLFSPHVTQEENEVYTRFSDKYYSIMGYEPDFYTSAMYDACWLYALSIIKTWVSEASFLKQELPDIAENYYGASGWLRLNEDGDRYAVDYNIWGYGLEDDQVVDVVYGYYDSIKGQVSWFEDAGINPPG
ncbi:MAG: ABC transporter substrate-binding protein [Candidatus Bathyarchaeia archaeon]